MARRDPRRHLRDSEVERQQSDRIGRSEATLGVTAESRPVISNSVHRAGGSPGYPRSRVAGMITERCPISHSSSRHGSADAAVAYANCKATVPRFVGPRAHGCDAGGQAEEFAPSFVRVRLRCLDLVRRPGLRTAIHPQVCGGGHRPSQQRDAAGLGEHSPNRVAAQARRGGRARDAASWTGTACHGIPIRRRRRSAAP